MKILILIYMAVSVNCRPYGEGHQGDSTVEVEKAVVKELKPETAKTSSSSLSYVINNDRSEELKNTEKIIQKIDEVNKRLAMKDVYVPLSALQRTGSARQANLQFTSSPLLNPILAYLIHEKDKEVENLSTNDINKYEASLSIINTNPKIEPEDKIPGQYVKRKVTHHQTLIAPVLGNSNNLLQEVFRYPQSPEIPSYQQHATEFLHYPNGWLPPPQKQQNQKRTQHSGNSSHPELIKKQLENQTVENIKNIVNHLPSQLIINPYYYPQNQLLPYQQLAATPVYHNQPIIENQGNSLGYKLNGPHEKIEIPEEIVYQEPLRPNKQVNWPLAQYFPIIIRDPLQQIFNAFTTMIEYGPPPSSGGGGNANQNQCLNLKDNEENKEEKLLNPNQNSTNVKSDQNISQEERKNETRESKTLNLFNSDNLNTENPLALAIEDLELANNHNNPMEVTLTFPNEERALKNFKKDNEDNLRLYTKRVPNNPDSLREQYSEKEDTKIFLKPKEKVKQGAVTVDEDIKLLSKDNTGSGVFIKRLKVTKGGVAIAGPGGIATAGSGGTAIVGPHGYAYTQPDSLAIAGSGTKVIAVDPEINLSEIIKNIRNGTGAHPRLGKIVAVGPVVYYNKG